jgi:tetratricopeptide (TPR) repeat protein
MSTSEIAKLESRWRENPNGLTFAPLAEAYRKQKDAQRALEILAPGLEKHPDYIPANIVLGRCHWDLNDLPNAERAFTHVLNLDGENVIALKALADINERLMHYDAAEQWLETLLSVDRSNDEARAQLERIHELQRERAEGSAAVPGAAAAAVDDVGAVDDVVPVAPLDAMESESPVMDESPPPPDAFEVTPEPPTAEDAGPVEYIGWVATPDDRVVPPEPLPLQDLADSDDRTELDAPAFSEHHDTADHPTLLTPPTPAVDPFGVEQSEEIVLNVSGQSEYQTPSAVDDLMAEVTGTPIGSIDDLRRDLAPPEPITSALSGTMPAEPEPDLVAPDLPDVEAPPASWTTRAAEFYALDEPPREVPAIEPEPEPVSSPPAPTRFATSEDLGDAPAVAEPDLVVTETMAEVLLSQGHLAEALTVYRELVRRSPDASHLTTRVADLEARQATTPAAPARPVYTARETGGQSVADLFHGLLAARPGDPPTRWPARTEPSAEPPPENASATRPAGEPLSLGSVFGDEPPPVAPAIRNSTEAPAPTAPAAPVSFDAFFGTASGEGGAPAPVGRSASPRRGDDLDQFHAWLQSLKR